LLPQALQNICAYALLQIYHPLPLFLVWPLLVFGEAFGRNDFAEVLLVLPFLQGQLLLVQLHSTRRVGDEGPDLRPREGCAMAPGAIFLVYLRWAGACFNAAVALLVGG